jgi:hypothetical protein
MYVEVKKDHQIKIKKKSLKSKNNKANYKNCQNRVPIMIFSKFKDMTVRVVIS